MHRLRDTVFDWFGMDSRVAGIDFIPRQQTVCLDPADYLAYVVHERSIDENSFKARTDQSIMGPGGYGGTICPEDLESMVEYWDNPDLLQNVLRDILENPFFRGPKTG